MPNPGHNPRCDGNQCEIPVGPTAYFELGQDGRVKLCKRCWHKWNNDGRYPKQTWATAEGCGAH